MKTEEEISIKVGADISSARGAIKELTKEMGRLESAIKKVNDAVIVLNFESREVRRAPWWKFWRMLL